MPVTPNPVSSTGELMSISYMKLRRAVGILGIALPLVLVFGNLILSTDCDKVQFSISDYYYTKMGPYFVGTLCAVGLFLFSYYGYTPKDRLAAKLACFCAIAVALNPTQSADAVSACNVQHRSSSDFVNVIHFASATILFLTLAFFSLKLFTKTSGEMTSQKKKRNKIYKTCGWVMIGSIIGLVLVSTVDPVQTALKAYSPVLILEWILLWAFGLSWLVKGEAILKDK